jgi:hypothetical protein
MNDWNQELKILWELNHEADIKQVEDWQSWKGQGKGGSIK